MTIRKLLNAGLYLLALFTGAAWIAPSAVADTLPVEAAQAASARIATLNINPSPLLAIDQNRTTVVERIVAAWGAVLAQSGAGLSAEQLREVLTGLRADHLLAASLAGNLQGLRSVIANALATDVAVNPSLRRATAMVDAADDLVYTPVTPCRLVDTRNAGGQIPADSSRDFKVWVGSGGFTAQGGSSTNCNIPANPVALVLNIIAVSPAGAGNFIAYPTGTPTLTSVIHYQAGQIAIANGAIVPACVPGCANQVTIATDGTNSAAHAVIDVVGYFKKHGDATGLDILANGQRVMRYEYNAFSPNVIGGEAGNAVTAGVFGASIAGGGTSGMQAVIEGVVYSCSGTCTNRVSDAFGTVGGGMSNEAGDAGGTTIDAMFATVAGGKLNKASAQNASVGGGTSNHATSVNAAIAGGNSNSATGPQAFVGGGILNQATGNASAIAGGTSNVAGGASAIIAGGIQNTASGDFATIGGGAVNSAKGASSTIPGGYGNATGDGTAGSGDFSFAAGQRAKAYGQGSFVWADSQPFDFVNAIGYNNVFSVRATGGATFTTDIDGTGNPARGVAILPGGVVDFGSNTRQMINLYGGATPSFGIGVQFGATYFRTNNAFCWYKGGVHSDIECDAGAGGTRLMRLDGGGNLYATSFTATSDRHAKRDFVKVDSASILRKVVALPITEWSFKQEPDTRHIGPMAQDFAAAFGVGIDDRHIATVDADGVALAAIQGLHQLLQEKDVKIDAQAQRILELEANAARVERRIATLESSQDELAAVKATLAELLRERAGMTQASLGPAAK